MKLNDIELVGFAPADATAVAGNTVSFVLVSDIAGATALDGQELKVTDGETDIAVFGGYELTGVERVSSDHVRATFARALEPNTAQAIQAIEKNAVIANVNINNATVTANAANAAAAAASNMAEVNAAAIEEIAATVFAE